MIAIEFVQHAGLFSVVGMIKSIHVFGNLVYFVTIYN